MYTNLLQKIDRDIAAQLKALGIGKRREQKFHFPCITISREFGCEGIPLAESLVRKLGTSDYPWVLFHRELITQLTEKEDLRKELVESVEPEHRGQLHQYFEHLLIHKPTNVELYKKMAETLRILAVRGRSVILGSGAAIITADIENSLHIRLQADMEFKVDRVSRVLGVSKNEAKEKILTADAKREQFIFDFTRKDVRDPSHYHLVFDNRRFTSEHITDLVYKALVIRNLIPQTDET